MPPGVPPPGMGFPGPPEDPTHRGKPKRRRFNFNVLENLEKMVAPKAPEQPTTDSAVAPAPPAPAAPPPLPSSAAPPPLAPLTPLTPTPARNAPPEIPRVPALTPPAESLPLSFGRPAETKPWPEPVREKAQPEPGAEAGGHDAAVHEAEPVATEPELPVFDSAAADEALKPETPAEPEPEPERRRWSGSPMRSMLFGEEKLPPVTEEPELEPAASAVPEPDLFASTAPESEPPASATTEPEPEPESEPAGSFRSRWLSHDEDFLKALGETPPAKEDSGTTTSTHEDLVSTPIEEAPPTFEPADDERAHEAEGAAQVPDEAVEATEEAAVRAYQEAVEAPDAADESMTEIHVVPVDEAAPAPGEGTHVPEPPTTDGHDKPSAGTLLIIEDDKTAASYYETLFEGNGYRVEVANDGVSGVDLATRVQPDVILLDVMMPRQNGILVLQTLRASDETKNTPVVVMSNFSEPTLIKRAIQLGALEYVIKTQVEGPALITAVPRWMNREKAFAAAA